MLRKPLLLVSLVSIGLAGCNRHSASPPSPGENVIAAGEIGSRLPGVFLKDFPGREISSAHPRGNVGLIEFLVTSASTLQKREARLSETSGPLRISGVSGRRLQIRHHAGYGRPSPVREKHGSALSAGGRGG